MSSSHTNWARSRPVLDLLVFHFVDFILPLFKDLPGRIPQKLHCGDTACCDGPGQFLVKSVVVKADGLDILVGVRKVNLFYAGPDEKTFEGPGSESGQWRD